jgi:hypothetical protein
MSRKLAYGLAVGKSVFLGGGRGTVADLLTFFSDSDFAD